MPQLIKPGSVKILTQDGEIQVSISLELTINLNADGLKVDAQTTEVKAQKVEEKSSEWLIPDFGPSQKINFGKNE